LICNPCFKLEALLAGSGCGINNYMERKSPNNPRDANIRQINGDKALLLAK
jgi:hypothetical protein